MPAAPESSVKPIERLGIVAGGGALPGVLVAACEQQDIMPFIVGFEGQTDPALVQGHNHVWTRLGAAGQIMQVLKSHEIRDLVLIGSIRRPSLAELRPDLKTAEFFARVGLKALGDNDLLGVLKTFLQEEGFEVHGVHKFADHLLAPRGPVGKGKPRKEDWVDIRRGFETAAQLGRLDIGQAAIVQEGIVLGVEAAEGTDELIRRCRHLRRKGRGGVLVKVAKPQQDNDLDLPTIGPDTVRLAAESGLAGIAVESGRSLIVERDEVARIADGEKMFVIGIDAQKDFSGP